MTDDEAIEACADVIREVMHAWSRGDQRRAALRAFGREGGAVPEGLRAEIEASQRAAWRRVRPALRALVEAAREVER